MPDNKNQNNGPVLPQEFIDVLIGQGTAKRKVDKLNSALESGDLRSYAQELGTPYTPNPSRYITEEEREKIDLIRNKYGYNVKAEDNINEILANNQSNSAKLFNGIVRMGGVAATTFAESFTGLTVGLPTAIIEGKPSAIWDNELSQKYDEFNNYLREALPLYYKEEYGDLSNLERMTKTNFWADAFLNGAGTILGAMAAGAVLKSANIGTAIGKIKKGADAYKNVKTGLEAVNQLNKTARIGKTASYVDTLLIDSVAAAGESAVEARGIKESVENKLKELRENGDPRYVNLDDEEIEKMASAAGNVGFALNFATVGITNFFTFGKLLRSIWNIERKAASKVAKSLIKEGYESTGLTALDRIKAYGKSLGSEPFQEGMQFAYEKGITDFYNSYNSDNSILENMLSASVHGLSETLGTVEGRESLILGGLLGGLTGTITTTSDLSKEAAYNTAQATVFNNIKSEKIKPLIDGIRQFGNYQAAMDNAAITGDRFNYENAKMGQAFSYIQSRIEAGRLDILESELDELANSISKEEFEKNFSEPGNKLTPQQAVARLKKQISEIEETSNKVDLAFPTLDYEQKLPLKYAFNVVKNVDGRIAELSRKHLNPQINSSNKGLFKSLIDLIKNNKEVTDDLKGFEPKIENETVSLYFQGLSETLKENPHLRNETVQDLEDLVKLEERREQYIQDIQDMSTLEGIEKKQRDAYLKAKEESDKKKSSFSIRGKKLSEVDDHIQSKVRGAKRENITDLQRRLADKSAFWNAIESGDFEKVTEALKSGAFTLEQDEIDTVEGNIGLMRKNLIGKAKKELGDRLVADEYGNIDLNVDFNNPQDVQSVMENFELLGVDSSIVTPENMQEQIEHITAEGTITETEKQINDVENALEKMKEVQDVTKDPTFESIREDFFRTYVNSGFQLLDTIENNDEYDDETSVDESIEDLKSLESLLKQADIKNTPYKNELLDNIKFILEEYKTLKVIINQRKLNKELKQKRILKRYATGLFTSLGVDTSNGELNDLGQIIRGLFESVKQGEFDSIIDKAKQDNWNAAYGEVLLGKLSKYLIGNQEAKDAISKFREEKTKAAKNKMIKAGFSKLMPQYWENPVKFATKPISRYLDDYHRDNKTYLAKFEDSADFDELVHNYETKKESFTDPSKILRDENIKLFIDVHDELVALSNLETIVSSDYQIEKQIQRELELVKKLGKEKTPTFQQLVAIRETLKYIKESSKGNLFEDIIYLRGAAGTGKTKFVLSWVIRLLGMNVNDIYVTGHNEHSSATANGAINKTDKTSITELNELLANNKFTGKLIVIDEIGGLNRDQLLVLAKNLSEFNKKKLTEGKPTVKMFTLGDPNQMTSGDTFYAPIEQMDETESTSVKMVSPLTVKYRSDVRQIIDFQDMFINNKGDVTSNEVIVKTNVSDNNGEVIGVRGTNNFIADVIQFIKEQTRSGENKSKVIITNKDPKKIKDYKDKLAAAGITDVDVVDYVDVQGRTVDQVFVDIKKNGREFTNDKLYNKALYTATSRAVNFIMMANMNLKNMVDDSVKQSKSISEEQIDLKFKNMQEELSKQLDVVKQFYEVKEEKKPIKPNKTEEEETEESEEKEKVNEEEDETETETEVLESNDIDDTLTKDEDGTDDGITSMEVVKNNEDYEESQFEDRDEISDGNTVIDLNTNIVSSDGNEFNLSFPTRKGLIEYEIGDDGVKRVTQVVNPGDKFIIVKRIKNQKTGEYLISVMVNTSGNEYKEIAALSQNEIDNLPDDNLRSLMSDESTPATNFSKRENHFVLKGKDPKPIASGTVTKAVPLTYVYDYNNGKKFNLSSILQKVINAFKSTSGLSEEQVDIITKNAKIQVFKKSDLKQISKNFPEGFVPIPGVPYVVIKGSGNFADQYIRLAPAKLNINNHKHLLEPLLNLQKASKALAEVLGKFGLNEQLGDDFFNHLIISIGRNHRVIPEIMLNELIFNVTQKYPSLSISQKYDINGYDNPVSIIDLAEELHALVFGEVTQSLDKVKEGSYVYLTDENGNKSLKEVTGLEDKTITITDEEGNPKEIKQTYVLTRNSFNTLERTLLTEVEPVRFEAHGPAQLALNAISKSNKEVNGMAFSTIKTMYKLINKNGKKVRAKEKQRGIPNDKETLRYGKQIITKKPVNNYLKYSDRKSLYSYEKIISALKSFEKTKAKQDPNFKPLESYDVDSIKNRYESPEFKADMDALLDRMGQPFNAEMLDTLLSFDENGDSNVNGGFGLRVPISINQQLINGKNVSYNSKYVPTPEVDNVMFEDILEDVIPTQVSISLNNVKKTSSDFAEGPSTPTESNNEFGNIEDLDFELPTKSFEFTEEELSDLGQMSESTARAYIQKLIPGIKPYQIQFLSRLEMMKFRNKEDWGLVKDGVIYLAKNEDDAFFTRVVRHEVFHKIFRSYLTSNERAELYKEVSQKYPETKGMTHLQKEEYLANLYEDWQKSRKSPSSKLGEFFRWIKKLFSFITANSNQIENVFERIESGAFRKESKEPMGSSIGYINIKETFGDAATYRTAKKFFLEALNKLTKLSSTEKDIATFENGVWKNITMSRDEAVKYILARYIPSVISKFESHINSKKQLSQEASDIYKAVKKLSKQEIYVKFLKDLYPNITIGNDGTININDEELDFELMFEDEETAYGVENDRINHEKKLSSQVKDFLSTIRFTLNGVEYPLNPRLGFVKLVEMMDGINPENAELTELEQLELIYKDLSKNPYNKAVYETLIELIETATYRNMVTGEPFPKNAFFSYERSELKDSSLVFKFNTETIKREDYSSHFDFLVAASKLSNLSIPMVNELYKKAAAADTLNGIYTTANSLRKKNVMLGLSEFKFNYNYSTPEQVAEEALVEAMEIANDPTNAGREEDKSNGWHYRYVKLYARTSHVVTNSHIKNAFIDQYEKMIALKNDFPKHNSSEVEKRKAIRKLLVALGMINTKEKEDSNDVVSNASTELITKVYDDVVSMIGVVSDIQKEVKSIDINKNLEDVREAITNHVNNNSGRINRLQELVEPLSSHLDRSTNYRGGDGFVRWLYEQSSQAYDNIRDLIKNNNKLLPAYLKGDLYKNNIFVNGVSSIKRFVDHDSVKQKDSDYVTHYKNEGSREWLLRNIFYQFNSGMSQVSDELTYIQSFNTVSNKPRTMSAEVKLLKQGDIRKAILQGLWQDVYRSEQIKNGKETDKNFTNNVEKNKLSQWLLSPEEYPTREILNDNNKAQALVNRVMEKLEQMSIETAETFIKKKVGIDGRLSNMNSRLLPWYANKFKNEKDGQLKNEYDISISEIELRKRVKRNDYSVTVPEILPYIDLFVKNYYVNNLFLNQLVVGDEAYFKNSYDEIKRMSIAFAQGAKGRVDNETGLRKTFKVAVIEDVKSNLSSTLTEMFPLLKGGNSIDTDGQGFCTPRRAANIRKGFGRDSNLSSTMKPVYYSVNENGKPVALKYSLIELTDELCRTFPELATLRFNLDFNGLSNNRAEARQLFDKLLNKTITSQELNRLQEYEKQSQPIDEGVFTSAVKVGAPVGRSSYNNGEFTITSDSIVDLENTNFRMQLNPRSKLNKMVTKPSQLLYFFNSYLNNTSEDTKLEKLMEKIIRLGRNNLDDELEAYNAKLLRSNVRKKLRNSSVKNDSEQRMVDFLSTKGISMNNPVIANKVVSQFASIVNKSSVGFKFNGAKLVLQSSIGTKINGKEPQLVFDKSTNKYYMEVYMPDLYLNELNTDDKGYLKLNTQQAKDFNKFLGFRIPSTEIHSAVPIKVIGFYPSKSGNENIIIAPKELVFLHGSDFDIDTLSVIRKSVAKRTIMDSNGNLIINKGKLFDQEHELLLITELTKVKDEIKTTKRTIDSVKESTEPVGENVLNDLNETLDKLNSRKRLILDSLNVVYTNQIVDILHDTLSSEKNWEMMMKPISMENFSGTFSDKESVFDMIYRIRYQNKEGYLPKPVKEEDETDESFDLKLDKWKNHRDSMIREKRNLNNPIDQMKMKADNTSGTILTGVFANSAKVFNYLLKANSAENKETVPFKESLHFKIGDNTYTGISRKDREGNWIWDTIDSMINAAIDNVKEQILEVINANSNTANIFTTMIGSGVPTNTAVKMMITPVMLDYAEGEKDFNKSNPTKSSIKDKMKELAKTELGIEDSSENQNAYQNYLKSLSFTEEDLDTLLKANLKSVDEIKGDKELAKIQLAIYAQLIKISKIGEEMFELSQFLNIVKELPNSFEDAQNKLDYLDTVFKRQEDSDKDVKNLSLSSEGFIKTKNANQYELKESFPFPTVQLLSVPIIKESYESLKWFKSKSENILFKHNKNLQLFVDAFISNQFDPRIEKKKNENKSKIREEFIKYISSGVSFEVKSINDENNKFEVNFDTTNEEPYTKKKEGNDLTTTVYGAEAWRQRFIQRVLTLKQSNPNNLFLNKIEIGIDSNTKLYYMTFPSVSSLEQVDRLEIEESFNKLNKDRDNFYYTPQQYDFLKYAILFEGGKYSMSNLSTVLPPTLYVPYDVEINRQLINLFNAKAEDLGITGVDKRKRLLDPKLKNIVENFAVQLAINYGKNLMDISQYNVKEKIIKTVDSHGDNSNKKNSNIYEIIVDGNPKRIFYDIALNTKEEMPLYITNGSKVFYKVMANKKDDKSINSYYQFVGYVSDKGSYQFSPKLFEEEYKMEDSYDIYKGNIGIKNNLPDDGLDIKTVEVNFYQQLFNAKPNDKINVFKYSDTTKRNSLVYTVTKVKNNAKDKNKRDVTLKLDVTNDKTIKTLFNMYKTKLSQSFNVNSQEELKRALEINPVETLERLKNC